jgi:hypothetical protein
MKTEVESIATEEESVVSLRHPVAGRVAFGGFLSTANAAECKTCSNRRKLDAGSGANCIGQSIM